MTEFGYGGNGDYSEEMGETYWRNGGGYEAGDQSASDILPDGAYDYNTPDAQISYGAESLPAVRGDDEIASELHVVPNAYRHNAPHLQSSEITGSRLPKRLFSWTGNPTHAQYPAENRPAENDPPSGLLGKPPFGNFETDSHHHGYDLDRPAGPVAPEETALSYDQAVEPAAPVIPYIKTEAARPKEEEDYIAQAWNIVEKWPRVGRLEDQEAVVGAIARGLRNRDLQNAADEQQPSQPAAISAPTPDNEPAHAAPDGTESYISEVAADQDIQTVRSYRGVAPVLNTTGSVPPIHQTLADELENRQIEEERRAFAADPLGAALPRRALRRDRPTSLADIADYPRPPAGTYIDYGGARVVIPSVKQPGDTPTEKAVGQLAPDPRSNRPDTGLAGLIERYAAELAAAETNPNTLHVDLVMMRERQQWLENQRTDQPAPVQKSPQPREPVQEVDDATLETILDRLRKL